MIFSFLGPIKTACWAYMRHKQRPPSFSCLINFLKKSYLLLEWNHFWQLCLSKKILFWQLWCCTWYTGVGSDRVPTHGVFCSGDSGELFFLCLYIWLWSEHKYTSGIIISMWKPMLVFAKCWCISTYLCFPCFFLKKIRIKLLQYAVAIFSWIFWRGMFKFVWPSDLLIW